MTNIAILGNILKVVTTTEEEFVDCFEEHFYGLLKQNHEEVIIDLHDARNLGDDAFRLIALAFISSNKGKKKVKARVPSHMLKAFKQGGLHKQMDVYVLREESIKEAKETFSSGNLSSFVDEDEYAPRKKAEPAMESSASAKPAPLHEIESAIMISPLPVEMNLPEATDSDFVSSDDSSIMSRDEALNQRQKFAQRQNLAPAKNAPFAPVKAAETVEPEELEPLEAEPELVPPAPAKAEAKAAGGKVFFSEDEIEAEAIHLDEKPAKPVKPKPTTPKNEQGITDIIRAEAALFGEDDEDDDDVSGADWTPEGEKKKKKKKKKRGQEVFDIPEEPPQEDDDDQDDANFGAPRGFFGAFGIGEEPSEVKEENEEPTAAPVQPANFAGAPLKKFPKLQEKETGKTIAIQKSEFVVGRKEQCDYMIKTPYVSKQHFKIFLQGEDWFILDCGSANGTFVNDKQVVSATRLHPGAVIAVAKTVEYPDGVRRFTFA
ncbi:MAG: FHA domain-containing protein [Planctomycetes bacterium]|nr:FHA domain-containing protein [Planctomycetota bacterium]